MLARNESPLLSDRGMRLGRPILGPNGESIPVDVNGKGGRVATRAGVFEIGQVRHVKEATRHDHLGQHTTTEGLNLLLDVAQESIAGPATE